MSDKLIGETVEFYEYRRTTNSYCEKRLAGTGVFLSFGVNYEELECGAGNYSTAIIRLDDGTVKNIPVEHIKFIKLETCEFMEG